MSRPHTTALTAVRNVQHAPATPAVPSILRYCATGYVAGEHWNERVCGAWSVNDVEAACRVAEDACRPNDDPELVLEGLRGLAEMLQVELPGPYGLDLLVEELAQLPRDLLEDAVRGLARTFTYRRFPVLAEIRAVVAEELARRVAFARAVRVLTVDHARRCGNTARSLPAPMARQASRGGGLRPVSSVVAVGAVKRARPGR